MAKVVATAKGYVGGMIREEGDVFEWPSDVPLGSWVRPQAFGGKGDHDGDGVTGGSVPSVEAPKRRGRPAKAFDEAPEPVVVGNGVREALPVEPDWIPPAHQPRPVED